MVGHPGFFDVDERLKDISAKGDDLEWLNQIVDFEVFRADLERAAPRSDRSKGGRPPYDHIVMFKVLILQANHLGGLLTRSTPSPAPTVSQLQPVVAHLAASHGEALTANLVRQARGEVWRPKPNDLQLGMKLARQQLRAKGFTEDQP